MSRDSKERLWFALTLIYAVVRVLGAAAFLQKYGLNIVVFAFVEIVSSSVLAVASAQFVRHVVGGPDEQTLTVRGRPTPDRHRVLRLRLWGVLVVLGFAAPDVYAYMATDQLPPALMVLLVSAIVISAGSTVVLIARRVRAARAEPLSIDMVES